MYTEEEQKANLPDNFEALNPDTVLIKVEQINQALQVKGFDKKVRQKLS